MSSTAQFLQISFIRTHQRSFMHVLAKRLSSDISRTDQEPLPTLILSCHEINASLCQSRCGTPYMIWLAGSDESENWIISVTL
jgi:hypothetical protein